MQTVYAQLSLVRRGRTPLRADLSAKCLCCGKGLSKPCLSCLPCPPCLPPSAPRRLGAPPPKGAYRALGAIAPRSAGAPRAAPPGSVGGGSWAPLPWHPMASRDIPRIPRALRAPAPFAAPLESRRAEAAPAQPGAPGPLFVCGEGRGAGSAAPAPASAPALPHTYVQTYRTPTYVACTYIYACAHVYVRAHIYVRTQTYACVYSHTDARRCTHTHTCT